METTKEKLIKKWYKDIQSGVEYKDKVSSFKNWDTYRKWYRNKFGTAKKTQKRTNNIVHPIISSIVANTYSLNPKVVCVPRNPEQVPGARFLEKLTNALIKDVDLKTTIRSAVREACLTGVGALHMGWSTQPRNYRSPTRSGLWIESVLSNSVIVPQYTISHQDLQWVAIFEGRLTEDVHEDPEFNETARKKIKGGTWSPPSSVHSPKSSIFGSTNSKDFCTVIRVYDKRSGSKYVFSEDQLLTEDKYTGVINEELPVDFIVFNEDPETFWGISLVQLIESHQEEANDIAKILSALRRQNMLKIMYKQGSLVDESVNNILSTEIDDIGIGIPIKGDIDVIEQAVKVFEVSPNNIGLMRDAETVNRQARETLNIGINQMGGYNPRHNTSAREAGIVQEASNIGVAVYRDIVASTVERILGRFIFLVLQTPGEYRGIDTFMSPEDEVAFESVRNADIKSEYTITIDLSDYPTPTDDSRKAEAMTLAGVLLQDPVINSNAETAVAFRQFLLEQFGWNHPQLSKLFNIQQSNQAMDATVQQILSGLLGMQGQGGQDAPVRF